MNAEEKITYFAESDYRNKRAKFGIKAKDRTRHVYVIGKTGMGKSTLLENMAAQDVKEDNGICFIDPHGGSAEKLLDYVPEHRINDVLYFAPFDLANPISFNVLEDVDPDKRYLVANGLMSAFKKIWVDMWSARMEYILNNVLLALLEYPDATLIGVNRMLADKTYRKRVVANIEDVSVKSFWEDEFAKYGDRYMQEAGASIQNKIGQFVSNPLVRNIIGQPGSSFDVRKMMDASKIMIVNLSKGRVGEDNANLIGSMLITKLYLGAMSRAEVPASEAKLLPNFYFYVDEFQSFANESFANILSEARKYKLNLTIAHQYIEQMTDEVRAAVFGNVGTMISFRVGATDAEYLEKEFSPTFTADDLVNLGFAQIYLRLMIDGIGSKPFSATTIPPIPELPQSHKEAIIEASRKNYSRPRAEVEETIIAWHESHAGVVSEEGKKKILATYKGEGEWKHRDDEDNTGNSSQGREKSGGNRNQGRNNSSSNSSHNSARNNSKNARQSSQQGNSSRSQSRGQNKRSGKQDSDQRNSQNSKDSKGGNRNQGTHSNEREQRLQKAISLRQLENKKQEEKEEKRKEEKGPSEENMSALRAALADVLKNEKQKDGGKKEIEKKSSSDKKTEEKKQSKPEKKKQLNKITKDSSDAKQEHKKQQSSSSSENKTPPQETKQEEKQKEQQGPKEVPEDVLKNLLEVKDEEVKSNI